MAKTKKKHVLLVEGPDDAHTLYHLLRRHLTRSQVDRISIESRGGIETLRKSLRDTLQEPALEQLGIIVDADTDLDARWHSLRDRLTELGGQNVPASPEPDGTIVTVEQSYRTIQVGIWLMPNNQLPGMLEDFLQFLLPTDDSLWKRAETSVREIPEDDLPFDLTGKDKAPWLKKAQIHTWLAWQKEPGRPLGQAITKSYLNPNAPLAQKLVDWLRKLFELGTKKG